MHGLTEKDCKRIRRLNNYDLGFAFRQMTKGLSKWEQEQRVEWLKDFVRQEARNKRLGHGTTAVRRKQPVAQSEEDYEATLARCRAYKGPCPF